MDARFNRSKITLKIILLAASSLVSSAFASHPTPIDIYDVTLINTSGLTALQQESTIILLDMRSPINYGRGRIPGAMSSPLKEESAHSESFDRSEHDWTPSRYGALKNSMIVIYSHGVTGWKSYKAAVMAADQGYTNIYWMREGFSAWKESGLPIEQ